MSSQVLSDMEAQLSLAFDTPPEWTTTQPAQPLVADQAKLQALLGRELPDALFTFRPWGHRVVITRDEPLRKIGGIHVPETALTPPARGTVVSVGPLVGTGHASFTGYCPYLPQRLLGAKVLFGAYAGQSLRIDPRDDDYLTYTVILTENEIWGLVGDLPEGSLL